jgi:beta-N-acetylhexosaminidase
VTVTRLLSLSAVALVALATGPTSAGATPAPTAARTVSAAPSAVVPAAESAATAGSPIATSLSRADRRRVERILRGMTLEEKVGQVFVVSFDGTSATAPDPVSATANMAAYGEAAATGMVARYHVGGVIYFGGNITSPQQLAQMSGALQNAARGSGAGIPLSISIDQEGGIVTRLNAPASMSPGNMAVGATDDPRNAKRAGRILAAEMRAMGINWNLAPVSDVNTQPYNQVDGARSFGDDPKQVPAFVRRAVRGQQAGGVASAAKHFPGLGSSKSNSDVAVAVSYQSARQFRTRDFPAFRAAIDADVETVLTAHLVARKLVGSGRPTSLSRKVVTGILRDELEFRGAVITDTLQAVALDAYPPDWVVVQAFLAGNDMLLMPVDLPDAIAALRSAVRDGTVSKRRLDDSVRRILRMKAKAGMLDPPWRGSPGRIGATVGTPDHVATMARIANESVTLIAPRGARVPLRPSTGSLLVAGTGNTAVPQMAAILQTYGFDTQTMVTGFGATESLIAQAVAAARQNSAVVILTYDVFGDRGQQRLLQALIATGLPVTVVPVNGPYDAPFADGAAAVVTSYGYTATNLQAVVGVLVGRDPPGTLPVRVPPAGETRKTLYPAGWGLSWSS